MGSISQILHDKFIDVFERFTGAIKQITNDHAYIHQGKFYEAYDKQDITTGAVYSYSIVTPATGYVHYRAGSIKTSADKLTVEMFEASTVTGGTAITYLNHNRNSTNTAGTVLKKGVTITVAGTLIDTYYIPGSTGVGGVREGSETSAEHEWVLKPATTYVIKYTNGSSGTNTVASNLTHYEETMGV